MGKPRRGKRKKSGNEIALLSLSLEPPVSEKRKKKKAGQRGGGKRIQTLSDNTPRLRCSDYL